MNKDNSISMSKQASQFIKFLRNKNSQNQIASNIAQQEMKQQIKASEFKDEDENNMDIQMRSDSAIQAQQLFGNLCPQSSVQQKIQQKTKNKKISIKIKKVERLQNKKIAVVDEQLRVNQTKSILSKGRIIQQKQQRETKKRKQQKSEEDNSQQQMPVSILRKGKIIEKEKDNKNQKMRQQSVQEGQSSQKQNNQNIKRKTVSFEGFLPLSADIQRKWTDKIQNQKKGKFDKEEQKTLSEALAKFLVSNDISLQQFQSLMVNKQKSQKFSRKQKIFSLLSTVLPHRSPLSCYKYLKRNFNSLNRKGKWTQDQIDKLKILVQKLGRKWTLISKQLKRTADNCYDKFRQLGEQNMDERMKGIWKFGELVEVLKLVEKMTKIHFLDHGIEKELQRANSHDQKQKSQVMNRKYNSKNFIFHNITILKPFINVRNFQKINISQIRWNDISSHIKTRNTLDCRNKVVQLLQIFFHSTPVQLDNEIVEFLIVNKYQSQNEINWKNWKHNEAPCQQAKNRYMILKKMIEGRSIKPFKTIVFELKQRLQKKKLSGSQSKQKKTQRMREQ